MTNLTEGLTRPGDLVAPQDDAPRVAADLMGRVVREEVGRLAGAAARVLGSAAWNSNYLWRSISKNTFSTYIHS